MTSSCKSARRSCRARVADYYAFTLLNQILAGPGRFESRLMNEMRQKRGLVYSVSSRIDADRDRGDLVITLSAAPQNVVSAVKLRSRPTCALSKRAGIARPNSPKPKRAWFRVVCSAKNLPPTSWANSRSWRASACRATTTRRSTNATAGLRPQISNASRKISASRRPDRDLRRSSHGAWVKMIETINPATGRNLKSSHYTSSARAATQKLGSRGRAQKAWRTRSFARAREGLLAAARRCCTRAKTSSAQPQRARWASRSPKRSPKSKNARGAATSTREHAARVSRR